MADEIDDCQLNGSDITHIKLPIEIFKSIGGIKQEDKSNDNKKKFSSTSQIGPNSNNQVKDENNKRLRIHPKDNKNQSFNYY